MPATIADPLTSVETIRVSSPLRWVAAVFLLLLVIAGAVFAAKWPFTQAKITAQLTGASKASVTIGRFRSTFFPLGCVAEDVTFRNSQLVAASSSVRVKTLTMESTVAGLLRKHLRLVRAEGAEIEAELPLKRNSAASPSGTQNRVVVERMVISNSVLQVMRNGKPLRFDIHEFSLSYPGSHQVMQYEADLSNPKPRGAIHAAGTVGPWSNQDPSGTHVVGSYTFRNAELGDIHGLGGIASSDGHFQGTFNDMTVDGRVLTPNFEVNHTSHRVPVSSRFVAHVDASSGVVSLSQFTGEFAGSTVLSHGSIHDPRNGEQKLTDLAISVTAGRIQDFLYLILKSPNPALTGILNFKGEGTLPAQLSPFLKEVGLSGDFSISDGELTNQGTQKKLDDLSQRARGNQKDGTDNAEPVSAELRGHVDLKDGVANLTNIRLHVPGSVALLSGTYNLLNKNIDLRGRVLTRVTLSKETSGMKSFILKMVGPFLKKNRIGGAVIPVIITGKYPHPIYKTDPM
jgi:hypothetical protein